MDGQKIDKSKNPENILLCDKIYAVAENNMLNAGVELNVSKIVFLNYINKDPFIVDIDEFQELNLSDFFYMVYLRLLNRLPDQDSWKTMYKVKNKLENVEIAVQYAIIRRIMHSREFKHIRKEIKGLVQQKQKIFMYYGIKLYYKIICFEILDKLEYIIWACLLGPIWDSLSNDKKNIVRMWFGREKK